MKGCPGGPRTLGDPWAGNQGHQRKDRKKFTVFWEWVGVHQVNVER